MGSTRLGQGHGRYEGTNRGQERPHQRDDAGHRLMGAEGICGAHIWGRFLPADGAARAGPEVGVRQACSGNSQEVSVAAGKWGKEGVWTLGCPAGARTLASVPPRVMGRREMQSYDGWKDHPSCGGSIVWGAKVEAFSLRDGVQPPVCRPRHSHTSWDGGPSLQAPWPGA